MVEDLELIPVPAADGRSGQRRISPKRLGEIAEAALLPKSQFIGLGVSKPWGDSDRYDYILDSGWKRWRTQVKCTATLHAGGYEIQAIHSVYGQGKRAYTASEIDLIVVYILPCDTWYVLPIEALEGTKSLRFHPQGGREGSRWERYREAWHLLTEPCREERCQEHGLCKGLKDWRKCFLRGVGMDGEGVDQAALGEEFKSKRF